MRRLGVAAAGAALLVGLGLPPSAVADPSDDAVAALKDSAIFVGADTPKVDRTKLGGNVLGDVKVAILPSGGPDATAVAKSIGERLDPGDAGLTVLVFEGNRYGAASSSHCGAGSAIDDAVTRNRAALQSTDDVTTTV